MVLMVMPTDALPRVLSTLPLVAGSKIRPTSLRVSSWRTMHPSENGASRRPSPPVYRSKYSYSFSSSSHTQVLLQLGPGWVCRDNFFDK